MLQEVGEVDDARNGLNHEWDEDEVEHLNVESPEFLDECIHEFSRVQCLIFHIIKCLNELKEVVFFALCLPEDPVRAEQLNLDKRLSMLLFAFLV